MLNLFVLVCSWFISAKANEYLDAVSSARLKFNQDFSKGIPASIYNISIPRKQIIDNLSNYRKYCPVAWNEEQILAKFEEDLRYTVEYKGRYYHMSSRRAFRKFVNNPNDYINGHELPDKLPFRLLPEDNGRIMDEHCMLRGCCAVTLRNSIAKG